MMRLGSVILEGSRASVRMPSSVGTNTRFREFSLRPMMKYTATACFPSPLFPRTMPRPG